MKASTLRPGLLVSLKTSVNGNVQYTKNTIEAEHRVEGGAEKAKWETERTVTDPEEHDRAIKARGRARQVVTAVCAHSAFGLLCPESASEELEKAIKEAHRIVDEFNETAALSRVTVYIITGRIAPDDVEAVRAINSEIRDLLDTMEQGVKTLDVKAIREAAGKAKAMGSMLSADATARVTVAVEAARAAAKKIVQAGTQAAQEIDFRAVRAITESRTAFLDMDSGTEMASPSAVGRAIDFTEGGNERPAPLAPRRAAAEV